MDRLEEIRTMILHVLKEGPMPGNVLTRKILESYQHVLHIEPRDMLHALHLSYSEGIIERYEKNNEICYRIKESGLEK